MTGSEGWRPQASMETLRLRADLLASIREFFARRKVLEVETPALSIAGCTDPNLDPLTTRVEALTSRVGARSSRTGALDDRSHYLATSPEHAMKRLLAAGSGDIYQLCRVYRDGELGRWHQPEFTLLEWYRVGWDEKALMREVDDLLRRLLAPHRPRNSTAFLSYRQAFRRCLDFDPGESSASLADRLERLGLTVPQGLYHDGLLDLALSTAVVPGFDPDSITFVYDYPASQAALARIKPASPPVAARFETFSGGLELANGYFELTDAEEQRSRFEAERRKRRDAGLPVPPVDENLLAALSHGLPACAGVAVGVDRLVALAAGLDNVADTMSFAH